MLESGQVKVQEYSRWAAYLDSSSSLDVTRFSAASTIPSAVWTPIAVEPSCLLFMHACVRGPHPYLDGFHGVLDLKESSLWRKSADAAIIPTPE